MRLAAAHDLGREHLGRALVGLQHLDRAAEAVGGRARGPVRAARPAPRTAGRRVRRRSPSPVTVISLPRTRICTGNAASIMRSSSSRWPSRPTMRWLPGTRILTEVVGGGLDVRGAAKVRSGVARRSPRSRPGLPDDSRDGSGRRRGGRAARARTPSSSRLRPMQRREHPQVGAADREHAAVEVLALELDRRREPVESICASGSSTSCRRTRSIVKPCRPGRSTLAGAVDEADLALELAGQQLVGRHLVDLGQAQQPGHRDRPLAPLVGTEHRRLELEARARLDVVERQTLLTPDRPEALADACSSRSPPAQPPQPDCRLPGECAADGSAMHASAAM